MCFSHSFSVHLQFIRCCFSSTKLLLLHQSKHQIKVIHLHFAEHSLADVPPRACVTVPDRENKNTPSHDEKTINEMVKRDKEKSFKRKITGWPRNGWPALHRVPVCPLFSVSYSFAFVDLPQLGDVVGQRIVGIRSG